MVWGLDFLCRGRSNARFREARIVAALLVAIVFGYTAVLELRDSSASTYSKVAARWLPLPGDNFLPHLLAEELAHGEAVRHADADWLSSDRPPLQTGWLLLTWPLAALLRTDAAVTSMAAAIWFQAAWVFAMYGVLRQLGIVHRRALCWTAVMALSGFFIVHTVYTWPKLAAASLCIGSIGVLFAGKEVLPERSPGTVGGALAALALLAHGAVAFSFLPLVPVAIGGVFISPRKWLSAAIAAALLVLPWLCYQRYYDPPGNRLLKWHLAGQISKDPRGTLETVRDAYRTQSARQWLEARQANFRTLKAVTWPWLFNFDPSLAQYRRNNEFFVLLRAPAWLLAGVLSLPIAWWRSRRLPVWRSHVRLLTWATSTLLLWCVLMYLPESTVIHQGSFAMMVGFFALLAAWCDLAGQWLLPVIALLQVCAFFTTYVPGSSPVDGSLHPGAVVLGVSAIFAIGGLLLRENWAAADEIQSLPAVAQHTDERELVDA